MLGPFLNALLCGTCLILSLPGAQAQHSVWCTVTCNKNRIFYMFCFPVSYMLSCSQWATAHWLVLGSSFLGAPLPDSQCASCAPSFTCCQESRWDGSNPTSKNRPGEQGRGPWDHKAHRKEPESLGAWRRPASVWLHTSRWSTFLVSSQPAFPLCLLFKELEKLTSAFAEPIIDSLAWIQFWHLQVLTCNLGMKHRPASQVPPDAYWQQGPAPCRRAQCPLPRVWGPRAVVSMASCLFSLPTPRIIASVASPAAICFETAVGQGRSLVTAGQELSSRDTSWLLPAC